MQNTAGLQLHRMTINNNSDFVELAYVRPDGSLIVETITDENDLCNKKFKINNVFKLFNCKKVDVEYMGKHYPVEQITSMQYLFDGKRVLGIVIDDMIRKINIGLVYIRRTDD